MTVRLPNLKQEELSRLPVGNVLVIAPAGCGKTEALAARALGVLASGEVAAPRRILALTYSNKAKANLASRIRDVVGAGWQQRISVTNFHGLATRVIKAHGRLLDIPSDVLLPEGSWRQKRLRELGIGWQNSDAFEEALREAKGGLVDDGEVMQRLQEMGHTEAQRFEEILRQEGRLDYDDLIRHAGRLLAIPQVARLYQAHFGMVMVDEVQDLSVRQYGIARAVGGDRVTYAGNPAQGFYSFAGADPVEVFERIKALSPTVVEFNQSYRSAPAVLTAVNALATELGTTRLECGDPDRWRNEGCVMLIEREDTQAEALALLRVVETILQDPTASIGVVGRRGSRTLHLRKAAEGAGVSFQDWSVPTHVPKVVGLLKRNVRRVLSAEGTALERLDQLEFLCRSEVEGSDADTLDEVASACDVLRDMVEQGSTIEQAVASCREAVSNDVPVVPGLHLLTGHRGKGQEFDWVIVIGLEDGHIPDFRSTSAEQLAEELRVLHVMVSRARCGLVVTYSAHTRTRFGWRPTSPSRWLELLRGVATTELSIAQSCAG
jgi:DNA helicase-2/ATP-dependent DNA helicase PcrA